VDGTIARTSTIARTYSIALHHRSAAPSQRTIALILRPSDQSFVRRSEQRLWRL